MQRCQKVENLLQLRLAAAHMIATSRNPEHGFTNGEKLLISVTDNLSCKRILHILHLLASLEGWRREHRARGARTPLASDYQTIRRSERILNLF